MCQDMVNSCSICLGISSMRCADVFFAGSGDYYRAISRRVDETAEGIMEEDIRE